MSILNTYTGLYTDHYELTMAQGYFLNGMQKNPVVFDYFFRTNPYKGGFMVFCGLEELLQSLTNFRYDAVSIRHLKKIGFDPEFLSYLANFHFSGNVYSVKEGELVFPYEPCVMVEGNIIEAQLVETILLNILNFESLIATKAARMRHAAGEKSLMDFGLRRAQGYGGIHASRAAVIGGFNNTSNVYSAMQFGLESTGTMAHSWIQSFENELAAFRAFAEKFPDHCILLVDTYDTLKSGVPNAIKVGLEMEKQGKKMLGIRLDSGDLAYLSKQARQMLDGAGLSYVQIVASNQLDEHVIKSLLEQSAPIDAFGVGTALTTGKDAGALDGVYKLCMINGQPSLKISDNIEKTTLPGKKELYRFTDDTGIFMSDGIALEKESGIKVIHHPFDKSKSLPIDGLKKEKLTTKVMADGEIITSLKKPKQSAQYVQSRLAQLPEEHKRFMNPHIYKVGISPGLMHLRDSLAGSRDT